MKQKNANQKVTSQQYSNQQTASQNDADLKVSNSDTEFMNAQGAIPYGMTNDYMFRAVLQTNNKALQGLICSLLHLNHEDVLSVEITNPIILGEAIENKEFRLDINVNLNNQTRINLEMQVAGKLIWPNRSLIYLCRSFDMLNHGQDYREIQPVIHISFLDYTLFDNYPEFYATNKLLNVKNYHVYSDKLTLNVVDLSRIDLATDEDKEYHIDYWAKLFKASTWEEIKMLAAKDQYIDEASKTIFQLSADEQVRKRCLDREEYYLDMRALERTVEEQDLGMKSLESTLDETALCFLALEIRL
ncbi:MAG: Rpn family recombination-promoting nuclease/putative transposase [Lachnospiraceae bacterium]|nr:Rpn family recombination-promoting nuclease/putative transposase [Lachnospiraceae bacterium]